MDPKQCSKTYCVNLFSQVATDNLGYLRPCCQFDEGVVDENGRKIHIQDMTPLEFFNSKEMKEMRRKANAGERVPGCQNCYTMEDNGATSMRMRDNYNHQKTIEMVGSDEAQSTIHAFDLRAGNLCNLGCVMCAPTASSKLDNLFRKHGSRTFSDDMLHLDELGETRNIKTWYEDEGIISTILDQTQDISKLWLLGGEPFINKTNFKILEALEHKGKHLELEVSTNLTVMNEELLSILSKFNTTLKCSIDGAGNVLEYIRFPADHSSVERHLQQLMDSPIRFDIVYTTSVLNVFHLPAFVAWLADLAETHGGNVSLGISNLVTYPGYLDIRNLPEALKRKAVDDLVQLEKNIDMLKRVGLNNGLRDLINFLKGPGDPEVLFGGIQYLDNFDRVRGNSWREIAPELADHIAAVPIKKETDSARQAECPSYIHK